MTFNSLFKKSGFMSRIDAILKKKDYSKVVYFKYFSKKVYVNTKHAY